MAQRELRAALAVQDHVWQARHQVVAARAALGEWLAGHPGPTPVRPNQASVLAEQDPLVRRIAT